MYISPSSLLKQSSQALKLATNWCNGGFSKSFQIGGAVAGGLEKFKL